MYDYITEEKLLVDERKKICIIIPPEKTHAGNYPYFKVYNATTVPTATKMIRLRFLSSGAVLHDKKAEKIHWKITKKDSDTIIEIMKRNFKNYCNITNWNAACYLWNQVNDKFIKYGDTSLYGHLNDYVLGKYDDDLADDIGYVPSTAPLPERWVYYETDKYLKRDEELSLFEKSLLGLID